MSKGDALAQKVLITCILSVPARLVGKRAGCKINWAQSRARTTKIRAQFSAQTTQNLLRVNDQNLVLWAIDENMGTNLQAYYKHFYVGCLKTQKQQFYIL